MKQIKIQCNTGTSLPLDAFIEFQGDLKELSKENYQKLKKEIEKTGFAFAPHVWKSKKDNKIAFYLIDGHQRIRTLRQMVKEGYECGEIPVVMVEAASMKEAKRRVLQGTSQYGRMTNDGLYEFVSESELEFQDVEDSFRLPDINFVDFKDEFLDDPNVDEAADEVPELRPDPKVKLGDLFILGNHRLLCGDSTDAAQVERLMNGEKADMVFTDPPYGVGLKYNQHDDSNLEKYYDLMRRWFKQAQLHCNFIAATVGHKNNNWWFKNFEPDSFVVWFDKTKQSPHSHAFLCKTELVLLWGKIPNGERYSWDILEITHDKIKDGAEFHACPKPIKLVEEILRPKTKKILDLFLGSGTTLIACEKTNRKCFGMELDPQYCQVIIERWQKYTNKEAVREDGVKFNALLLQD